MDICPHSYRHAADESAEAVNVPLPPSGAVPVRHAPRSSVGFAGSHMRAGGGADGGSGADGGGTSGSGGGTDGGGGDGGSEGGGVAGTEFSPLHPIQIAVSSVLYQMSS